MLVRVLLAVACLGAAYLAYVSLSNGPVAGCGTDSGCNKVLQSRWAYWLGVPVSLPALFVYLGLLAATFAAERKSEPENQRRAWTVIVVLSVVVAGAAAWFIGLQIFVIKAYCKFCMTAHVCGMVSAIVCLKKVPLGVELVKPRWSDKAGKYFLPRQAFLRCVVVGVIGVAVLAGGQLLVQKKRNVVSELPVVTATNFPIVSPPPPSIPPVAVAPRTNTPVALVTNLAAATSAPPAPVPAPALAPGPASRVLSLHGGAFQINLAEVPMIGPSNAPHVIVSLFDYTCHHCRQLHPLLVEAQRHFANQLGIVSLPMPMSTNCNPSITRYFRAHALACDYAKLGLAVWRAKPEAFHQFDDWLMKPENPVPVPQAHEYAAQLVGVMKLESALQDDWVTRQIHTDGYLYHSNYLKTGNSQMPELMIGPFVSFGPLNSVADLLRLLKDHLGLTP